MNYANMIEEAKLKKTFIMATLISTIAGTFITGLNLYDRVIDKRHQTKRDKGQDQKIRELEQQVERNRQNRLNDQRDNDLRDSLEYSGPMVRREYDQRLARMGPKFAQGDMIAQTQLQGQIITLQGTVIKLLEEALMTGRPPNVNSLYNASEFAREGTIRALQDQYQRLLQAAPLQRPVAPVRRTSSTPTLRDGGGGSSVSGAGSEWGGPRKPQKALTFNEDGPLYCPYAEELQRSNRPLDINFSEDGTRECPACRSFIPIEPGRSWRVNKEIVHERISKRPREQEIVEVVELRTYLLSNRFIVKCHREGAGYACYLCYRNRSADTLSKGMKGLADHVMDEHTIEELERDPDILGRDER